LRFVTPVLPLIYAGAAVALAAAAAGSVRRSRGLQLLLLGTSPALAAVEPSDLTADGPNMFKGNVGLARLVEKNLPAGTTMTIYAAGTVPYYANQIRYIDIYGKNDQHLAHLPRYDGLVLGHNRLDFTYVYDQRRPAVAFVLAPCGTVRELVATAKSPLGLQREIPVHQRDVGHPTFLREYASQQIHFVGFPSPSPTECLFVRRDSGLPLFWSPVGTPPRPHGLALDCDILDGSKPASFEDGWGPVEDHEGRSIRRLQPDQVAMLDLWLAVDEPARFSMCLTRTPGSLRVTVNGEEMPLLSAAHADCPGEVRQGTASRQTLASNRSVTRLALTAQEEVALDWLRAAVGPDSPGP
jgi:hypothetical protein